MQYYDYFKLRGLDDEVIRAFNLGWCREDGKSSHKDFLPFIDSRFYNKVLFPIYNLHGSLISVSSRSIQKDEKGYIHTAYSKRFHLYGLNVTYPYILSSRKVYIVEGNFDLLTLYKQGIKNVVAMLGSKLSLEQASLLVRFADELILASDSDNAGKKCALNFVDLLKRNDISFKILKLPFGEDPDTFVKKFGAEAFIKLEPKNLLQRVSEIKI